MHHYVDGRPEGAHQEHRSNEFVILGIGAFRVPRILQLDEHQRLFSEPRKRYFPGARRPVLMSSHDDFQVFVISQ